MCKFFFNVSCKLLNRMVSLEKVRWMRNTLLVGNILTGFRIGTYLETVRGGFAEIFGEIKKYHIGEICYASNVEFAGWYLCERLP